MLQIILVDELHLTAGLDSEVKRTPRHQNGFVAYNWQINVRFCMKFRHGSPIF